MIWPILIGFNKRPGSFAIAAINKRIDKTQITITTARLAMEALPGTLFSQPKNEIMNLIGSAEENATDTLAENDEETDWETVAIRSLELNLCESSVSPAARKFFDNIGLIY